MNVHGGLLGLIWRAFSFDCETPEKKFAGFWLGLSQTQGSPANLPFFHRTSSNFAWKGVPDILDVPHVPAVPNPSAA